MAFASTQKGEIDGVAQPPSPRTLDKNIGRRQTPKGAASQPRSTPRPRGVDAGRQVRGSADDYFLGGDET